MDLINLNNNVRVKRVGTWKVESTSARTGGHCMVGKEADDYVVFSFVGTTLYFHVFKGNDLGSFKVYIDGTNHGTIDLHDSGKDLYETIVQCPGATLTSIGHIVKLVVVNPNAYIDSVYAPESASVTVGDVGIKDSGGNSIDPSIKPDITPEAGSLDLAAAPLDFKTTNAGNHQINVIALNFSTSVARTIIISLNDGTTDFVLITKTSYTGLDYVLTDKFRLDPATELRVRVGQTSGTVEYRVVKEVL